MSPSTLHLVLTTPQQVLADVADVAALRAEDASGSFGILPGHADFVTTLNASVVRWRRFDGSMRYAAVQGGVLVTEGGRDVRIACREGVLSDNLATLQVQVQTAREAQADADRRERVERARLHTQVVRQLLRYLQPRPGDMQDLARVLGENRP